MHAPFTPVYEDSLIAIASYTVGRCDDTNSISIATNVRRFTKWIKSIRKSTFLSHAVDIFALSSAFECLQRNDDCRHRRSYQERRIKEEE